MKEGQDITPKISEIEQDDPEILAAKVVAQKKLKKFNKLFEKYNLDQRHKFFVKAPFVENRKREHMWVQVEKFEQGTYEGYVNNKPHILRKVKIWDQAIVSQDEVEDWLVQDHDEKEYIGGFSLHVFDDQAQ